MPRKALITGITGQDGGYLAKLLLNKGYEVVGVTRPQRELNLLGLRYLQVEQKIQIERAELTDAQAVFGLLEKHRPDEIYNLSAQSSVGKSFKIPVETISQNILSALNLLEGVRVTLPQSRLYQASSSEMFGRVPVSALPITEMSIPSPSSPYAVSKTSCHWATMNYREAYGLFACSGILFNHESVLRGPDFVTKKIISTVVKISRGEANELVLGNMNIARDWGYAPHYAEAMWLMMQQNHPDDFIICSGAAHSLEEFVNTAFEAVGLSAKKYLRQDPALFRPVDLGIVYGDNSKARQKLGWNYSLTFPELLKTLIEEEVRFQEFLSRL